MFTRLGRHFGKFWRSEDGAALAFVAAMLFSLVGMAALAIDIGHAYANRQRMQSAADTAAMSGAIALSLSESEVVNGRAASASSGWTDGADGVSVAINRLAASGALASYTGAVEAIVQQPMSTAFSGLFGLTSMTVAARAVAAIPTTSYCMIALSTTAPKAFNVAGTATVGTPGCGLASNSTKTGNNNGGFNIQGNAVVNAPVRSAGSISEPGQPTVYSAPPFPMSNATPGVTDPYAGNGQKDWLTNLATSAPNPCNAPLCSTNGATAGVTYDATNASQPIHFKGKTSLASGTTTFQNGVFYFYDTLSTSGTGVLKTNNATLVVFNQFKGNGVNQLSAPKNDSPGARNSGWAIASPNSDITLAGGATSSLIGTVYVPNNAVSMSGNITSPCAQVIASTIDVSGTVALSFDGSCGAQDVKSTAAIALIQ